MALWFLSFIKIFNVALYIWVETEMVQELSSTSSSDLLGQVQAKVTNVRKTAAATATSLKRIQEKMAAYKTIQSGKV